MNKNKMYKDKIFLIILGLTVLFLLISGILIYINIDTLSYPLVLHFSEFQGVDTVGDAVDLWSIFFMTVGISLINFLLATYFYFRQRLLAYIMISVSILLSFLSVIGVANIISLN